MVKLGFWLGVTGLKASGLPGRMVRLDAKRTGKCSLGFCAQPWGCWGRGMGGEGGEVQWPIPRTHVPSTRGRASQPETSRRGVNSPGLRQSF